ncbi:polysaccharide pyruvyl transferase family protein [Sphaerotilus mobilis]|uniref:polysaccharide pyruvyl transferase family protein n=1 Tax=Sphaerotilus mobilis TaxID=47994 RepID=UPI0013EEAF09|nr:polysaccharide pyruvyl transferase family protein [Sphaerotilus mobilis]
MVALFDTSVASENVGDFIIMDAVNLELSGLLTRHQTITLPTHDSIGKVGRNIVQRSDFSVIGGTNILSSHLRQYRQWKFGALDIPLLRDVVLMGVGWWQYQDKPDWLSALFYRKALSRRHLHSVRDSYAEEKLRSIGIENVINTGCPTMWRLDPDHCRAIPLGKAAQVVFTITDYKPNLDRDRALIRQLTASYQTIFFWPQGSGDLRYLASLIDVHASNIKVLSPSLASFNGVLDGGNIDYVGTRLHAGIRALQRRVRAMIISVDNRATEKQRDFGLPVIEGDQVGILADILKQERATAVRLPQEEIARWKQQFKSV